MDQETLQAWITATTKHAEATDQVMKAMQESILTIAKQVEILCSHLQGSEANINTEYLKILSKPPRRGMDAAQCYEEAIKRTS